MFDFFAGKEAGAMRKALLVIVLIAAAFAGGAVMNGPGLVWAKKYLGSHAGGLIALDSGELTKPEGESAKPEDSAQAESSPQPSSGAAPSKPAEAAPAPEVPSAPLPPLRISPDQPTAAAPANATPPADPKPVEPKAILPDEPKPIADETPLLEPPKEKEAAGKPRDNAWADAPAKTILPRSTSDAAAAPAGVRRDPVVTTAGLAQPEGPEDPVPTVAPARDWGEIRRRMKEMGVSRFWLESEPGGPSRFRCVIPLAGTRAVAQHFEAEGDDEFQAADAALRRVALWRATER